MGSPDSFPGEGPRIVILGLVLCLIALVGASEQQGNSSHHALHWLTVSHAVDLKHLSATLGCLAAWLPRDSLDDPDRAACKCLR